jgi:hypothetical protein
MAERARTPREQRDAEAGFFRRWSRRKAEARTPADAPSEDRSVLAEHAAASAEPMPAATSGAPAPVDPVELPDIDSLDSNSDFTVFMRPGVPEHLRTLALRKLWRSDPIFSKLDRLVEYGGDYTIPSWPKGAIKTAYQIGRGFVNELDKLAGEENAAGTAGEGGRGATAAEAQPPAVAGDAPQPVLEATRPGTDAAAEPPREGVLAEGCARSRPGRG